ncbi:unnamed protein product [Ambrosiozyma monospora]|uniref:Unnamed protein product n=1 Tax=Ambrosiozyma monospora TaxID=43982 RepID=A0ACB5T4Q8_AMBMO|nr:unnamed protein product [Ambrosiozyma monospora]
MERIDRRLFKGYCSRLIFGKEIRWLLGWFTPLFYVILMSLCLNYFMVAVYPVVVLSYNCDPIWNFRFLFIIMPTLVLNYWSFAMATLCDAGNISKLSPEKMNLMKQKFKCNGLIFFDGFQCRTCLTPKIARSKHCSTCNDRCVLLFDHHCIWLNNDVGYYNYRYFLLFLFEISITLAYGSYLCYVGLCYNLERFQLPPDIQSQYRFKQLWFLMRETSLQNEIMGVLCLLAGILCPLVAMFLFEHLWYIYLGVTTNEALKWDYIRQLIEYKVLFKFTKLPSNEEVFLMTEPDDTSELGVVFKRLSNDEPFRVVSGKLDRIESWDDLDNIYDNGFWKNLHERMFPVM